MRQWLLALAAMGGVALTVWGHTPYRQWSVYRSDHLLIVAAAADPRAFPLAQTVAAELRVRIPQAQPEPVRAPDVAHIARLLGTHQLEVSIVQDGQAKRIAHGQGEAGDDGPVPLRLLGFLSDSYVLVSHEDYDPGKAKLLVSALYSEPRPIWLSSSVATLEKMSSRAEELQIPLHAATREFLLNPRRPAVNKP